MDRIGILRVTARRSTRVDGVGQRRLSVSEAAQRTAAAVTLLEGWQWPAWLDRQRRPGHVAFVPAGELEAIENLTGRAATTIGTVGAGPLAVVDPAGFVVPHNGQWGLDWSVRGTERWHPAALAPTLRQRLVEDTPVVETALRVGDGDVVQRVYGVAGERDAGDLVVIDFDNETSLPVAIALAVRPCHLLGVGVIDAIEFDANGGRVNEQPCLLFPRPPAAYDSGSYESGDSLARVHADAATPEAPRRRTCTLGLGNGAVVFPVPHRSALRVLLAPRAPRRSSPKAPDRLAGPEAAARGWITHTRKAATPAHLDDTYASSYSTALRRLMLAIEGSAVVSGPDGGVMAETMIVNTLTRAGLGRHVAPVLAAQFDEHRVDGWVRRDEPSVTRNIGLLDVLTTHWRCTRDATTALGCLPSAFKLLQWCMRRLERREGQVPATVLDRQIGLLIEIAEESESPVTADDLAELQRVVRWHVVNDDGGPAGAESPGDESEPLLVSARGIEIAASLARVPALITARDPHALSILSAVIAMRSPTGSWPTVRHPRTGAGSAGSDDDPTVAAAYVSAALSLSADETYPPSGPIEIALLPVPSPAWRTASIDVRNIFLGAGRLSYSVRWHGERPALLWELEPRAADLSVRFTCPGLDRDWSTSDRSGEALLVAWST